MFAALGGSLFGGLIYLDHPGFGGQGEALEVLFTCFSLLFSLRHHGISPLSLIDQAACLQGNVGVCMQAAGTIYISVNYNSMYIGFGSLVNMMVSGCLCPHCGE